MPLGTIDFTRAQVFFHPTVVQNGQVLAADTDYREFKGGWSRPIQHQGGWWSEPIQRYVAMEGGQLAGARLMPLLVPFTTMGAMWNPALNMFSDRPVETLNAIMSAIQRELVPLAAQNPSLAAVGVSSFSSGISAMKLFLSAMVPSGLVKEVTDFDSPFIISEPKTLTLAPGAVSRCYTQHILSHPPVGWVNLPGANFVHITSFNNVHAIIGFMMYFSAMLSSTMI